MTRRLLLLACALAPALALADDPALAPPPEAVEVAPPVDPSPAAPSPTVAVPPAVDAAPPAAAPPAVADAPLPAPPPPPPQTEPDPRLGFSLGAGFPQAVTLSVLYRPLPWLRLSAGPAWDYVGWGFSGGVVLSPIRWAVSPTLGLEAGRFFEIDANRYVKSADAGVQPLLQRMQLRYVAATLGLEFGSQRGFAFALRTGLTYLQVDSRGTGTFTSSGGTSGANDAVITVTRPSVRGTVPTVQLVFQYFL